MKEDAGERKSASGCIYVTPLVRVGLVMEYVAGDVGPVKTFLAGISGFPLSPPPSLLLLLL